MEVKGLTGAIAELVRQNEVKDSLAIDFKFREGFPNLNNQLEIAIFRIVQEFISNSLNHGKATKIDLHFDHNDDRLELNLKDDGVGFDISKVYHGRGMGLKNIYSRVQSYNGNISVNSAKDRGTEFHISLPVQ